MTDPQDTRSLVLRREYPDPIGVVWAALTESERLGRWIGTYTGRGAVGGTVEFTVTGEVDAGGEVAPPATVTILECEPPGGSARLVVDIPESPERTWRVTVTLAEQAGRTALVFGQGVPEGLDPADVEAGWSWYLDRLGAALHDEPMPAWADYAPAGRPS